MTPDYFDNINDDLDDATDGYDFHSEHAAWSVVALVLEQHGLEVPSVEEIPDEMVFRVQQDEETEPHYLYVAIEANEDLTDPRFDVLACIANEEDLDMIDALAEETEPLVE
ncbi:MAG: hypothetical protein ACREQ5_24390 [Candidatus Dormibacteria bacterium]